MDLMIKFPALKFFKKKQPSPYFLALDLGSDFCKVLIFKRPEEEDGKLKVVGVGKAPQGLTDTRLGVPADIEAITKNIEAALGEAALSCEVEPKEVVLGLSGEMTSALSTRIRLTREKPEKPLSKRELAKIEKKVCDAAFIEACEEMARRKGRENIEIGITNSETTQVEVDGFLAADPVGFKGEKIELSYFTAFSPRNHLYILESIIRSLGLRSLIATSAMYALLKMQLFHREPSEFDRLILDIGGEVTDIGVSFSGNIIASRTLPVGGRDFTRVLARKKDLSFSEAENLKLRFSAGEIPPEQEADLKELLADTLEFWGLGVKEALLGMSEVEEFPSRISLCGGGSGLSGISELLSTPEWAREISFPCDPQVKILDPSNFDFFDDETGKLKSSEWTMPLALGYFGWQL